MSSEPTDEDLVRRARGGDTEAFRQLYARHETRLRALARRRVRGRVRSKVGDSDLVQEAYRVAFERLDTFEDRGPGSFRRWLDQILLNKAWDEVKRFTRARRNVRREESPGSAIDAVRRPDQAPGPSSVAVREEEDRALRAAVEALSGDDRVVLHLVHERRMPLAEAAVVLGRSPEAVRKLYGRVVLRLTERLRTTRGPS